LEKVFRRQLGLHGTPIRVEYRASDNPYKNKGVKSGAKPAQRSKKITKYSKRNEKK
jgi:GTP-binding protein